MANRAVAILICGSHGMERELARAVGLRGYAVVVVHMDKLDDALEQSAVLTVRADITDELDVERVFEETKLVLGEIDVVVHAASSSARLVAEQAARHLRDGGLLITVSTTHAISSALASELHASGIALYEVAPLTPRHTAAAVLAFLDRRPPEP